MYKTCALTLFSYVYKDQFMNKNIKKILTAFSLTQQCDLGLTSVATFSVF